MTNDNGYWVNGTTIKNIGYGKHIEYICAHPEEFGLTKNRINEVFAKHREKVNQEGNAREELVKLACDSGWIRVRQYIDPEYWSIQFDAWHKRKKDVCHFVQWAIGKGIMSKNEEIRLVGFRDNYSQIYAFVDGGAIKLLEENQPKSRHND